jgi:hypothetical protein
MFELVLVRRKLVLLRLLALFGLAGQVASLADALLVQHVTCLVHGDRIHATPGTPETSVRWSRLRDSAADEDEHDHLRCLIDDDVDFVPGPSQAPLATQVGSWSPLPVLAAPPLAPRAPLYRLAPKNSPPV